MFEFETRGGEYEIARKIGAPESGKVAIFIDLFTHTRQTAERWRFEGTEGYLLRFHCVLRQVGMWGWVARAGGAMVEGFYFPLLLLLRVFRMLGCKVRYGGKSWPPTTIILIV